MDDFISNAAANLVGTFVGAGLAFLTAWAVARRQQALSEISKLQRLIDRIYRSRALRKVPRTAARSAELNEYERADCERVTRSIFTIRSLIEDAANTFNAGASTVSVLDDMYGATLDYLNAIEIDDRNYINEVMRLREALLEGERRLKQLHPKLVLREPGGIEPEVA
ncbi:hypothetical protein [Thermoactinospora rubra]|uniref:hypothetical protein n=1 Tax=Thermoactinospora rubra TaxID=1088767 RepID=UPI00117F55A7|nr:hypothetical protein [Thermoactinospora rubra]